VAWKVSRPEFFVMMATFIISLVQTVKEGLLIGFVLSILNTIHGLAHPNLVLCGRLPDGNWRDVRNFVQAVPIEGAIVVRMDARINFANCRKLKEFVIRCVQDRERRGHHVKYAIIDAKPINDCDLSGIETLEALTEGLKKTGQQLLVANLKGPLVARFHKCHFPSMLRKNGGALCTDMAQAEAIVAGEDPEVAWKHTDDLAANVQNAQRIQTAVSHTGIGAVCGAVCTPGGGGKEGVSYRSGYDSDREKTNATLANLGKG
jgi:MFS superfamily sulfate permease-like transporter